MKLSELVDLSAAEIRRRVLGMLRFRADEELADVLVSLVQAFKHRRALDPVLCPECAAVVTIEFPRIVDAGGRLWHWHCAQRALDHLASEVEAEEKASA